MQLIIGIIFVFITGPLSSHLIMKLPTTLKHHIPKTKIDEIKEGYEAYKTIIHTLRVLYQN